LHRMGKSHKKRDVLVGTGKKFPLRKVEDRKGKRVPCEEVEENNRIPEILNTNLR